MRAISRGLLPSPLLTTGQKTTTIRVATTLTISLCQVSVVQNCLHDRAICHKWVRTTEWKLPAHATRAKQGLMALWASPDSGAAGEIQRKMNGKWKVISVCFLARFSLFFLSSLSFSFALISLLYLTFSLISALLWYCLGSIQFKQIYFNLLISFFSSYSISD